MNCRTCEELFVSVLYNDPDVEPAARAAFDEHIRSCSGCARLYAGMQSTLETMDKRERHEPGQAYWDGYWNRLTARMEREETEARGRRWFGRLSPSFSRTGSERAAGFRWAYRGAMAAALIVVGIVAGRIFLPGPAPTPDTRPVTVAEVPEQTAPAVGVQASQEEMTVACAHQYIEDSQVLLLGLVNFDPETEREYIADWSSRKERSRELITQAASLKGGLEGSRQRRLRDLVSELEIILMQIANMETTGDLESVELIQSSVRDRDVLLRINLEKMRGGDAECKAPDNTKDA